MTENNAVHIPINSRFFQVFFVIGVLITVVGIAFYVVPPLVSTNYSYTTNYRGFYVFTNDSSTLEPVYMSLEINTIEEPKLYFDYHYSVTENGSYYFIFLFPFEINDSINPFDPMNFTKTPYGSAVWVSRNFDTVNPSGSGDHLNGVFLINNTFQSGTQGEYVFSIPLVWEFRLSDELRELQEKLDLNYNVPQVSLEFSLFVPSSYQINQLNPEPTVQDSFFVSSRNQTIKKIGWNFSRLNLLEQQFIIFCEDRGEISQHQLYILFAGIFVSIGTSLIVRTVYDFAKERYKNRST